MPMIILFGRMVQRAASWLSNCWPQQPTFPCHAPSGGLGPAPRFSEPCSHACRRGPPLLPFDWSAWGDNQGTAVPGAKPPSVEGEAGWFVVRTASTDPDGWLYASTFSKLCTPRPGGRASKRSSDHVRNRLWRKLMVDRVSRGCEGMLVWGSQGVARPAQLPGRGLRVRWR